MAIYWNISEAIYSYVDDIITRTNFENKWTGVSFTGKIRTSFKILISFTGIVSTGAGGVTRLRKISDIRSTLEGTSRAFDQAIESAQSRETPQSKNCNPVFNIHITIQQAFI